MFADKKTKKTIILLSIILGCICLVKRLLIYESINFSNYVYVSKIRDNHIYVRTYFNIEYVFKNKSELEYKIFQNLYIKGLIINLNNTKMLNPTVLVKATQLDFRYYFFSFYNDFSNYKELITPIVFGHYFSFKNELIKLTSEIGLIHLIIISGFHFIVLKKILSKFMKNKILTLIFITIYWSLCSNSVSINRAFLMLLFSEIKNYKNNKNHYIVFVLVICLSLKSNDKLELGYWLSFIISFLLMNISIKKTLINKVLIYFLVWLVSMLILLSNGKEINILGIFLILFLTPFFELFFILLLIAFCVPLISINLSSFMFFSIRSISNIKIILDLDLSIYRNLIFILIYMIIWFTTREKYI
ncbi:ComEC/Rec2 family competence protein [Mycoplasma sp. CSL7503-lung]|uniref:ComEC/Rec2 family competence protein n=1 Tax=Mycoplasma sp. CSL7503-lung TaxID=536372 RepID=UPI0021D06348|nr:ComEC/Rec2 family competence protein [Mycoplasma sp. CSL7503-lung]MCU4706706.1 ComEC/Rec2 family competence protein [Mycoplasma sp. CSL7503-lung]